jgi:hypothetical protein
MVPQAYCRAAKGLKNREANMLADDAFPSLAAGREGLKQAFRMFRDATPGRREIEDQQISNDPQPRPGGSAAPSFSRLLAPFNPLRRAPGPARTVTGYRRLLWRH